MFKWIYPSSLDNEGIKIELIGADNEKYEEFVKKGNYDIILRSAILDNNPDPSWIYLGDPYKNVYGSEVLDKYSEYTPYSETNRKLGTLYNNSNDIISKTEFYDILMKVKETSPYVGLGFIFNGMMQSKRVRGNLESDSFNKYNNIGDVWIWSGQ